MARRLRIQASGATYHVITNATFGRRLFVENDDRRWFGYRLEDVVLRFEWSCKSYCLLGTHYHLLITTPKPNLAEGMKRLNGMYAQAFNDRHGQFGRLLRDRYHTELVESEGHFFAVLRYIARNPVRAALCDNPADWRWSSYPASIGLATPAPFPDLDGLLKAIRPRPSGRPLAAARARRRRTARATKLAQMDRWATFDCYGTLIDWNGGIRRELARVFTEQRADELLACYHQLEPELEANGTRTYREVLTEAMRRLGAPPDEHHALASSLPTWQPFPEVPAALEAARAEGWKLAILSNTDRDFIEASMRNLGVPFELAIVASEIGSYKPAHRHWKQFFDQTNAKPEAHAHVAASLFHDIAPANELGLRTIWINRLGERPNPRPTKELPDLTPFPEALTRTSAGRPKRTPPPQRS